MPEFSTYIDLEVYEFIDECTKSEINDLIDELIDRGHLTKNSKVHVKQNQYTLNEETHRTYCDILANSYHIMNKEDEDTIMSIAKKYS
jgi:aryl-alcohol dehydrogenase-like predicted oxidoreductase